MAIFFRLTHPEYKDDFEDERINPVWTKRRCDFPVLLCSNCGVINNFFDTINIPLPPQEIQYELKQIDEIASADWPTEVDRWAKRLGVDPKRITPGAGIGPPIGLLNGMPSKDFIYPSSTTWVRTRVKEKLESIGCKGVEFAKAEFIYRGSQAEPFEFCDGCHADYDPIDLEHLPEYWGLISTGKAWREGQDD